MDLPVAFANGERVVGDRKRVQDADRRVVAGPVHWKEDLAYAKLRIDSGKSANAPVAALH